MSRFKQLLTLSCFLSILSAMGLTLYSMKGGFPADSLPLSAQVVSATTAQNATSGMAPTPPAAQVQDSPLNDSSLEISDAALTTSDTAVSSLITNDVYDLTAVERSLVSRTNIIRSQNNLPNFSLNAALSTAAAQRSADMIERQYFSHTTPDGCSLRCRFEQRDTAAVLFGENIAEYKKYQSLDEVEVAATLFSMWLESSTHRENILSKKFTDMGIGIAVKGEWIVVTVLFTQE